MDNHWYDGYVHGEGGPFILLKRNEGGNSKRYTPMVVNQKGLEECTVGVFCDGTYRLLMAQREMRSEKSYIILDEKSKAFADCMDNGCIWIGTRFVASKNGNIMVFVTTTMTLVEMLVYTKDGRFSRCFAVPLFFADHLYMHIEKLLAGQTDPGNDKPVLDKLCSLDVYSVRDYTATTYHKSYKPIITQDFSEEGNFKFIPIGNENV